MGETVKLQGKNRMTGSLAGFAISIVIGLGFHFGLTALSGLNQTFDYKNLVSGILVSVL